VPEARALAERMEAELPRHGETGCTNEGALTVLYSADGDEGSVSRDVHRSMTRPLVPRTLEWAACHPTAHFAVSVAAGGLTGAELFRLRRAAIVHCIGASGAIPGRNLAFADRGFWCGAAMNARLVSSVDQCSLCVVSMGQSAVGAWDLSLRLRACGMSPSVHGPSSCLERGVAEYSPAAKLLRDRGIAVQAFPPWFPRSALPPTDNRVQWALDQPFTDWEGDVACVPAVSFREEVDPVTPAPFDPTVAVGEGMQDASLRPTHTGPAVLLTTPDTVVAPAVETAPGGVAAFSVYARAPGDDVGRGSQPSEAAVMHWDVEEAYGMDGGLPMRAVRAAIEQALLQGDARDLHPTHYDLRERGMDENDVYELDAVWLSYRRGRREAGDGCVLRSATRRQAEVMKRRLERAGLVAAVHRDADKDEHLSDEDKALPEHRPPGVSQMDRLFLRMSRLYRGRIAPGEHHGGGRLRDAIQRLAELDAASDARDPAGIRSLTNPRTFVDFIRGVHRHFAQVLESVRPTAKDAIDSFEHWTWGDAARAAVPKDDHVCGIYMTEFEEGDEVMRLPCKHVFGSEAIGRWLSEHLTCPICRKAMPRAPNRLLQAAMIWEPCVPEPGADMATGLPPSGLTLRRTASFGLSTGPAMAIAHRIESPGLTTKLAAINLTLRAIACAIARPGDGRWEFTETLLVERLAASGFIVGPCLDYLRTKCPDGVPSLACLPHMTAVLEAGGDGLDRPSNVLVRRTYELLAHVAQGGSTVGALENFGWSAGGIWKPSAVPAAAASLMADPAAPAGPCPDVPLEAGEGCRILMADNPGLMDVLRRIDGKIRAVAAVVTHQNAELWSEVCEPIIDELVAARFEIRSAFTRVWQGKRHRDAVLSGMRPGTPQDPGNRAVAHRLLELVTCGYNDLHAVDRHLGRPARTRVLRWDSHLKSLALELCAVPPERKRSWAEADGMPIPCAEGTGAAAASSSSSMASGAAAAAAVPGAFMEASQSSKGTGELSPTVLAAVRRIRQCEGPGWSIHRAAELIAGGERSMRVILAASDGPTGGLARRLLELVRRLEGCEAFARAAARASPGAGFGHHDAVTPTLKFYHTKVMAGGVADVRKRTFSLGGDATAAKRAAALKTGEPAFRLILEGLGFQFAGTGDTETMELTQQGLDLFPCVGLYITDRSVFEDPLVAPQRWF